MSTIKNGNKIIDAQSEQQHNDWQFSELVKKVRPDIWLIMDAIDLTGIDPLIVMKFVRALNNISIGTKHGEVNIKVVNDVVTFIYGQESDRVNLPIKNKDTGVNKYSY